MPGLTLLFRLTHHSEGWIWFRSRLRLGTGRRDIRLGGISHDGEVTDLLDRDDCPDKDGGLCYASNTSTCPGTVQQKR